MSEEFGDDLFSISDDEGHEFVLEHVDTVELDGTYYLAFLPTDIDETDERYGLIILKAVSPDATSDLVVPTDSETAAAYEAFMLRLYPDAHDTIIDEDDETDGGAE